MEYQQQFINENKVSEVTGIALSTLRNNRCKGRGIPYVKVGRSVRYEFQDVIDFMQAHKIRTEKYWKSEESL